MTTARGGGARGAKDVVRARGVKLYGELASFDQLFTFLTVPMCARAARGACAPRAPCAAP
jgi:hypothetical protein